MARDNIRLWDKDTCTREFVTNINSTVANGVVSMFAIESFDGYESKTRFVLGSYEGSEPE